MNPRTYKILRTDKTMDVVTLTRKATLAELQSWVGGYIQGVKITGQQYAFVNEEGLIHGLPKNPFFPSLVGNVVLCPPRCTT